MITDSTNNSKTTNQTTTAATTTATATATAATTTQTATMIMTVIFRQDPTHMVQKSRWMNMRMALEMSLISVYVSLML